VYVASCVSNACTYTAAATACANGCFQDQCNTSGPSFDGDAVAPPGMLDKEMDLNPSVGSEAANTAITATVKITPHNSVASVTLNYTTDNFTTTNPVPCTLSATSGADDVWSATIPAQAAGTTVRFYYQAVDYSSNSLFLPGNFVNYTYVSQ
jgi:hypothetical protein